MRNTAKNIRHKKIAQSQECSAGNCKRLHSEGKRVSELGTRVELQNQCASPGSHTVEMQEARHNKYGEEIQSIPQGHERSHARKQRRLCILEYDAPTTRTSESWCQPRDPYCL